MSGIWRAIWGADCYPHWDEEGVRTTYLVPRPSFWSGWGTAADLSGYTLDRYNISATPEEADRIAAYLDWKMVGQDLARVLSHASDHVKLPG
jgi:hypothetical protein